MGDFKYDKNGYLIRGQFSWEKTDSRAVKKEPLSRRDIEQAQKLVKRLEDRQTDVPSHLIKVIHPDFTGVICDDGYHAKFSGGCQASNWERDERRHGEPEDGGKVPPGYEGGIHHR